MAAARTSQSVTEPAGLPDGGASESFHTALAASPPDCVVRINPGQSAQEQAESDSGDSLFITQKPVPEAVRARPRRGPKSPTSPTFPTSPTHLEESDGDSPLSAFHREPVADRHRGRKKHRLPKYSFSVLAKRRGKPRGTMLRAHENTGLHYAAMGGFFQCVRELQARRAPPSLPTVDMEGDHMSPLSEDEEENIEIEEDIKIVERTCFLVPSKANRQQSWYSQQGRRRKAGNVERETSAEQQKETPPPEAPTLRVAHTESSDDGGSPSRGLDEVTDQHEISDGHVVAQTETPRTKSHLLQGNRTVNLQQRAEGDELCDGSDATACELEETPRPHTDEPPGGHNLLHSVPGLLSDTNSGSVCSKTAVKRKGDYENVEGERGQSQEEPEGLHAAASASGEVHETPSLLEDNRREHPAPQPSDMLEFNDKNGTENQEQDDAILRQEEGDIPSPKQREKVRKKDKSAAENLQQEEFGNLESDVGAKETVLSGSCDVVTDGKEEEMKKKRKRSDEDAEQPQSCAEITEERQEEEARSRTSDLPPVSTRETVESGSCSENTAASQEALQPGAVKRKRHKELSCDDGTEDGGEGAHGSFSNGAVTLTNDTEVSLKKKKKEKALSEGLDVSHSLEENDKFENADEQKTKCSEEQNGELVTKKKKKKNKEKVSETSGRNTSKDNLAQSDDSVSARETKEKKKKALSEGLDVSHTLEENEKFENVDEKTKMCSEEQNGELVTTKKKKKKKVLSEGLDVSHTLEENEKFENADEQKTKCSEEQNSELVTTKKKKKKNKNQEKVSETSGRNTSKDNLAQSDDSVSARETKKKKKASSFLVADAEESDTRTHDGQNLPPQHADVHVWGDQICSVRKKKKKRRMSAGQDGVENDHEQDLEEANKTSASPESTGSGVKRRNACVGSESEPVTPLERPEGAADEGHSATDEATVVMKKKKKKKKKKHEDEPCHVTQKSPQSEESKLLNAEISHSSSTSDHVTKTTMNKVKHTPPSSQAPADQPLNGRKKKLKRDDDVVVLPERNSVTSSAELEPQENKSIPAGSPVLSETSLCRKKKKPKTGKRTLHNPSEDFLV